MHLSFYKRPLVILLIVYTLVLALFLKTPKTDNSFLNFTQTPLSLQGEVVSYPTYKNGKTNFILKLDKTYNNKKVYAYSFKEDCKNILRGSKISYTGKIEALPKQENFGSFNWGLFLRRKNISAQTRIEEINKIEKASLFWLNISKVRKSILNVFEENFDKEFLPIISGITLGEKGDISRALYSDFQDSGAMHLLVASGGNVGFITLIVYFLCSLFGFRRLARACFALTLALFYTLIAGADAPLLRAYLMAFCSTLGFVLGRKSGLLQGFVLAGLIILIFNPQSLFEAGFQMSFLATFSIILFVANFKIKKDLPKYLKILIEMFLISLVAQLSLLPVFCNYFHKISLSAPLSNIILIPLSACIMSGGFVLWLINFLPFGFLIKSIVFILNNLLIIFKFFVEAFASLPISKIVCPSLNSLLVIIFYLIFFSFLNLPLIKNKKRFICLICFIGLILFGFSFCFGVKKTEILKGRYNYVVLDKDKSFVRVFGAGIKGDILRSALLTLGTKQIDCLFVKGSASSLYALKDLEDIKIKKIYLEQDFINDKAEKLLKNTETKINFIWP
ncbi:MAG: ComEC/Rec2 family competence protein, partial [Campylobacter sp.]|nr:ComEC/Rec2 family competence protein [Campylobacter sp.]